MLTTIMDIVLAPLTVLPPMAGLLVASLVITLAMLLVVKATSSAPRLETAKRQMYAALLEMRLFDDDLRAVLRAAVEVFRRNLSYLWALAPSLLVVTIPLVLLLAHLDSFYRSTGFTAGVPALLTVRLERTALAGEGAIDPAWARLEAPDGVRVETPAIWFPANGELVWRVAPQTAGRHELVVRVGDESVSKTLDVSDAVKRRAPSRIRGAWLNTLLEPSDLDLPRGGVVREIALAYPPRELRLFGWSVHWLVPLLASSLVFAFALRRPLNVSI